MSSHAQKTRPLLRQVCHSWSKEAHTTQPATLRRFTTRPALAAEALATEPSTSTALDPALDPALVASGSGEKATKKTMPLIGSRRRRAALQTSDNIPFEQLPYQCFQEARKILQANREEKLGEIEEQRARLVKLQAQPTSSAVAERQKDNRVTSMQKRLEELKVLADINDPLVKKRFEDGEGDMNRPVYRYLADREWRSYRRKVQLQRIMQMSVVPDVLPHIDPVAEVRLAFRRRKVQPGEIVDSRTSELSGRLNIHVFDKGERLVTVVVVDPDVPNVESDSFSSRCHFFAVNIPVSPTSSSVPLMTLPADEHLLLPWLPPYSQKGMPYHRLAVIVLQQPDGRRLDRSSMLKRVKRDDFHLRRYLSQYGLKPVGAFLFRAKWDEGTAGVMERAGLPGADLEFKRKRIGPLIKPQWPLKKFKNRLGLAGLPSKRL
ncbi:MAG: hypothetical protein M1826_004698 [Phylliscum demangeonii]|nr:MAG: hypothetical protein M1826_004698 [Phylliscum demangeonii]